MKLFRDPGRPTVAVIDLDSLAFNFRQIQKRVPRGVEIMGVVKADGYGHGAVPVALRLEKLGAKWLGVAISDEGVELRRGGVRAPILVLGGAYPEDVDQFFKFRLTPVVFHKKSLELLSKSAEKHRRKVRVHIKVDTGMGRLGLPLEMFNRFLRDLKRFPRIETEGILSHFSMTDEEEVHYTFEQWKIFQEALAMAQAAGVSFEYMHIANSVNLAAFPAFSGNLVRPGIILYGSYPSGRCRQHLKLRPVMTLRTRICHLKAVPPGKRISYGGSFTTRRESLIATLPIGYADGYNRRLSNRGEVLVRGRRAPVVGRVCMDYTMADVTDVPGVSMGDDVVLLGRQKGEEITAEEIAEKAGTISYEVFCLIGKRVPRVYRG